MTRPSTFSWRRAIRTGFGALITLAGALGTGCLDRPVSPATPDTTNVFVDDIRQQGVDKIDLLFMIDNSISMADKQAILADAVPELVRRLVTPICVDPATQQPTGGNAPCSGGSEPEFKAVDNIHIGVISSSLGGHGGDICSGDSQNDKSHLMGTKRPNLASFNNQGFLWWGPDQQKTPGAHTDANALINDFKAHVTATGEDGCGYEASLESWYRFLIDPEPPETIVVNGQGFAERTGIDATVIAQREAFLRPDSLVAVIMLSDENDCSLREDGGNSVLGQAYALASSKPFNQANMPRGRSACNTNPDDECCYTCALGDKANCTPAAQDAECQKGLYGKAEDDLNLRCWQQKRRFGEDWLYPTQRYVDGLRKQQVPNRVGEMVPNPLFKGGSGVAPRDPNLVYLAGIVGVPWQLISTPESQTGNTLKYLTATELNQQGIWSKITEEGTKPPGDPHMVESVDPRPNLPGPGAAPGADPFHGHDWDIRKSPQVLDLQYACTFKLQQPRDCSSTGGACDCDSASVAAGVNNPLCQAPGGAYGTTQYHAKAFPGLRELRVLRDFGQNSIVASICPKNADKSQVPVTDPNYGYNPAVSAIVDRLKEVLNVKCLPRPLDVNPADNTVQCAIVETSLGAVDCNLPGRKAVDPALVGPVRKQLAEKGQCGPGSADQTPCDQYQMCEIAFAGEVGSLNECLSNPNENAINPPGWCYVDPDKNIGDPALVAACPPTQRRLLRFVGQDTPRPGSTVFIACLGGAVTE